MRLLTFSSYEQYVEAQTQTNRRKLKKIWVTPKELRAVARYVRRHIPGAAFGLCHGVRNGYEVRRLRELLGIEVLGTEISDTADQFEHVIRWDYHEVRPEWQEAVDFIYSNSWDHSYDPELMLERWVSCLRPQGRCFLHWNADYSRENAQGADCFSASLEEIQALVRKRHELETVLEVRAVRWHQNVRRELGRWWRTGRSRLVRRSSVLVIRRSDSR
jgi:hypothetical protein